MRDDISDYLIHFTKGDSLEDAFQRLINILDEQVIRGFNNVIRGGYTCVCFSEAPLSSLKNGLLNSDFYSEYSPFGILTNKKYVFELGGRPVIYQSEDEYNSLDEEHRWRHMRYEPNNDPPIDYTWEREWRIQTDAFQFDPGVISVVVPENSWAERLLQGDYVAADSQFYQYSQIMDETLAMQYAMLDQEGTRPFEYDIVLLNDN